MEFGCLTISEDKSCLKELHSMAGNYGYEVKEVSLDGLRDTMSGKEFRGINIEGSLCAASVPLVSKLSNEASAAGFIDTVINDDGVLIGHCTLYSGLRELLSKLCGNLIGKKVLIIGTGANADTAENVSKSLGADEVAVIRSESIDPERDESGKYADAHVIINAPEDLVLSDTDFCPVDIESFHCLQAVADMAYSPIRSRLVLSAAEKGLKAMGGLYMLCACASMSEALFNGKKYNSSLTDRIFEDTLYSRLNLVLIGMPSCGKTTVGERSAEIMGRPFADTDRSIVMRTGRTISNIISTDGEEYFRTLEDTEIRALSGTTGMVIASGGGSILNPENVRLLKMNGKLVFLDRPLGELSVSKDRPISDTRKKLDKLYKTRLPIYRNAADRTVTTSWVVDDTVRSVLRVFWE